VAFHFIITPSNEKGLLYILYVYVTFLDTFTSQVWWIRLVTIQHFYTRHFKRCIEVLYLATCHITLCKCYLRHYRFLHLLSIDLYYCHTQIYLCLLRLEDLWKNPCFPSWLSTSLRVIMININIQPTYWIVLYVPGFI